MRTIVITCRVVSLAALLFVIAQGARAQDANTPGLEVPEAVREAHTAHLSPHLIVLDPKTTSATLTVSNSGDAPIDADVRIEFGYTAWQNKDTVLFSSAWQAEGPHDTIIAQPGRHDHDAGPWISGVPAHLTLKAHETRRLTVRIAPPNGLPNGEYYARIVTVSGPRRQSSKAGQDVKTTYALPVHAQGPPPLRDSVRVFYRQGPQSMGVAFPMAKAAIDASGSAPARDGQNPLRYLVRVHLTGTAHFEGYKSNYYITQTGERLYVTDPNGHAFTIHSDAIIRNFVETDMLGPGHYTFVFRLIPRQDEFPPSQRVPMDTAEVSMPLDIR